MAEVLDSWAEVVDLWVEVLDPCEDTCKDAGADPSSGGGALRAGWWLVLPSLRSDASSSP